LEAGVSVSDEQVLSHVATLANWLCEQASRADVLEMTGTFATADGTMRLRVDDDRRVWLRLDDDGRGGTECEELEVTPIVRERARAR
jgi:hypothetical protein